MIWWRAVAALVVSLGVQIGTNYVNDYADGIRGTDDVRVGPIRLVGQKLASPDAVRKVIAAHVQGPALGFLGQSRVNVLVTNRALDAAVPKSG